MVIFVGKYEIPRQKFAESLAFHAKDKKIIAIQDEMLDMMDKSVHGVTPALTIDKRVQISIKYRQNKLSQNNKSKAYTKT